MNVAELGLHARILIDLLNFGYSTSFLTSRLGPPVAANPCTAGPVVTSLGLGLDHEMCLMF